MVHLKDVKASGELPNVPPGTGIARIANVIKTLREVSYGGLVAIEYEHDGPVETRSVRRSNTRGRFCKSALSFQLSAFRFQVSGFRFQLPSAFCPLSSDS